MDPPVGAFVSVPAGKGFVRFSGETTFAAGKWVGVELEQPNGKNDGSVQGKPYFRCKMGHGMFVRPSQVKVLKQPEPANPMPPPTSRPGLGHQRTPSLVRNGTHTNGVTTVGRTPSASRKTTPSVAGSGPGSRSVSPAKQASPPSPAPAARPIQIKRLSLGGSAVRKSLGSRTASNGNNASPPSAPSPRLPPETPSAQRALSPPLSAHLRTSSPLAGQSLTNSISPPSSPLLESLPPPSSPLIDRPPPPAPPPVDDTELQELRAKVRVLEAHRGDDARRMRELEARLTESDQFISVKPKLLGRITSLATELGEAKRELADAAQMAEMAESRTLDSQEQLEMAALDKEMAEERAEAAEAELEEVKERLAVVEVELEVLKEGGTTSAGEGGEEDRDDGKNTLAFIQLEKQNERLKEALMRLRDISQDTEQEQRRRITELEKDVMSVDDLQGQYETALVKLTNAEVQIEDLKLQLDDALGAEDMLVQLTERNLMLSEKIEEMRINIEDLEALKELNDELEENHIETERVLQEDLDRKEADLRDRTQRIESLEEACDDLDNTIGQFRELVMGLQSELDQLRAQTQTAQTESATAASQTAAMMSLNLKLQSSASKNQTRGIELELKRLEAREARELLSIVQPYLPQAYVETDSDATSCYLFFQRLGFKADLINNVVAQANGLPDSLNGPVSDVLVGTCEMRGHVSSLSTLCKRFAAVLRRCDPQSFLDIGRIYPEVAPMEKRIDMHIDLLRRDEFRDRECVADVLKIHAQFKHLGETFFDGFEHDLCERELGYALSFDNDLDMFSAAIGLTKTSVSSILKDQDINFDMDDMDIEEEFIEPLGTLIDQCKTAKVLSRKLTKRLEDLMQESTALKQYLLPQLQTLNNLVPELTNFAIGLAQQIIPHISDARSSKTPFQLSEVLNFVKQTAAQTVCKGRRDGSTSWDAIGESVMQVVQEVGKMLPLALEPENVVKISGKAPWVARVDEIKASLAVNLEAERRAAQLNDEIQGLVRGLKAKDQHIQETTVKIELMERRMETVKKQAETITDLEAELGKVRKQERTYQEAMEQLQADLDELEQDNAKLKAAAPAETKPAAAGPAIEAETVATEGNFETSYLLEQLDALRGTVRYLRTENSYLKGQDLLKEIDALPPITIPVPAPREATPPLEPSRLSDSESDSDEDELRTRPLTLRSLATETKVLYRDVMRFSSAPRVVDLSARRNADGSRRAAWVPRKSTPAYQILERKQEAERLSRRVHGLLERTSALGNS